MRETIEARFDSRKEKSSRNDRRIFLKSLPGEIDTPLKMFLAIALQAVHEFGSLMPTPTRPPSPLSRSVKLIYRNTVPILFAIFVAMWGWRAMTPQQLFATEDERARLLSAVGASPSIRVITLGTEWCPACKQLEQSLTSDKVPHVALDVEKDRIGGELFRRAAQITGSNSIPKIILDKDIVSQPKLFVELARGDGGGR
jgi:glutaredoxin